MNIVLLDANLADQGGQQTWPGLKKLGSISRYDRSTPTEAIERLQGCEVVITNKVIFSKDLLAACPSLQHIAVTATGINTIDLDACRSRGIAVSNVPAYSTDSVAQQVFAHILEDASAVAEHAGRVQAGDWVACPDFCFVVRPTWELAGKRLALIGHGAIGQTVQRIAEGFGMLVDIVQLPWRPAVAGRVPLDQALARADVISLHCPLTDETAGLVGADFLAKCQEHLLLINTGRGPLIDEAALAEWLHAHPLARASVDVLGAEPPRADNPLLGHPQVRITPHSAWATNEALARLRRIVVDNIRSWRSGEQLNRVD